jgi:hypothetical protein
MIAQRAKNHSEIEILNCAADTGLGQSRSEQKITVKLTENHDVLGAACTERRDIPQRFKIAALTAHQLMR